MSDSTPLRSVRSGRFRLAAAALLLGVTIAGGVALRVAAKSGGSAPPAIPPSASAARGAVGIDVHLDRSSVLASSDGLVRLELVLRGEYAQDAARTTLPTDLVVVLDRSGSMDGDPLRFAKAAIHEILGQLRPEDRFALVSYAFDARTDIALAEATSEARSRFGRVVETIPAGGGTNLSAGLDTAHALVARSRAAGRAARMLLLSDGHANEGDHSAAGLSRRAGRAVTSEYVLSTVGIGQGFDEQLMSGLADSGTGNFYYLPHLEALAGVFAEEFAAARETVARALVIELAPAHGVRVERAGGYPLEHDAKRVRFRPGDLFAGQERRIWVTLHTPTDLVTDVALGGVFARWSDGGGTERALAIDPLPTVACVADETDYYASFDENVYKRGDRQEAIGRLKQSVARGLASGDQKKASADVGAFIDRWRNEQVRAFGAASVADEADLEALESVVNAPAAAEPERQNELSKKLLEEGRDARRVGSKRR